MTKFAVIYERACYGTVSEVVTCEDVQVVSGCVVFYRRNSQNGCEEVVKTIAAGQWFEVSEVKEVNDKA